MLVYTEIASSFIFITNDIHTYPKCCQIDCELQKKRTINKKHFLPFVSVKKLMKLDIGILKKGNLLHTFSLKICNMQTFLAFLQTFFFQLQRKFCRPFGSSESFVLERFCKLGNVFSSTLRPLTFFGKQGTFWWVV